MSISEIVQSGKFKFKITRNIEYYRDEIWTHTYKIGGIYPDCINISYFYQDNKPLRALIPHLLYEPEYTSLDAGGGTEIMVKTAIRYAFNDVKTLPNFEFQDNSHIDCIEKNLSINPPRKMLKPLNLAYFYIAYHGMTWYEARFNAEMLDKQKYTTYRNKLKFLTDPAGKPSFAEFKAIILSTFGSLELLIYVEKLYKKTNTYREFFEEIPKSKRCEILYPWLNTFMEHYLADVFSVKDWIINVNTMDNSKNLTIGGSLTKGSNYRIFSYQKTANL
jgi:hypothetical protein